MSERVLTLFASCVQTITLPRTTAFSRRRTLPLARLIVVRISLGASGRDTGVATKRHACFTWARRRGRWPEGHRPLRSALTKARATRPWQTLARLLHRVVALAYEVLPPRAASPWCGLSVFACEGSTDTVPATEAMRQTCAPHRGVAGPGLGHDPQCRVMTVADVVRRMPVGRTICPLQEGDERGQAQRVLPLVPRNSGLLCDRGFPSDGFRLARHQHPHRSVMRGPATSTVPAVAGVVRSGRAETVLWLTPADTCKRARLPAPRRLRAALRLRAIRLVAPDGPVAVLLTHLMDRRRFPRTASIALSWRRWAVETHDHDEKTLQQIERFHRRTPDGMRQALLAILIGWVIARTLTALSVPSESLETAQSLVRPQLQNARLSFARDAALWLPAYPAPALGILQELLHTICQVKDYKPTIPRPSCPRVNKQSANTWQVDR